MRLAAYFLIFGITCILAAPTSDAKPSRREANKQAVIEVFGKVITLPEWINKSRISVLNFCNKVKKFFSGDMQLSTEVFGKKISFRTNIPDNKEDVSKSITRFFSNVKTDSATRIVFVIYLNLVVMFVTYILFFVKQIQLHRRQKREEKTLKKQRKIEEEERRWLAHGESGLYDIPLINNMTGLPKDSTVFEEKRGAGILDTSIFEQSIRDMGDDDINLELNRSERELLPEMISPVSSRSHSVQEIRVQADVHSPAKEDIDV